jgi:hypothetical protein
MPDLARVVSTLPFGLCLHLSWTAPVAVQERGPVTLAPGVNAIDREFWDLWAADHRDADVLAKHFVYEVT